MKYPKFTTTFLLSGAVFFAIGLSSCKKGDTGAQGTTGATGPAGPSLSGNLAGYVQLFDQYGGQFKVNLDSVMVTIDGVNDTTYTDSTGRYQFNNLSTGIYNMTFSKSGYGGVKPAAMQFTGGGTLYHANVNLSAIPNFNVVGMRDSVNTTNALITDSVAATDTRVRSVVLYVGSSSSVSPTSYLSLYTKNIGVTANSYTTTFNIPISDFNDLGFASGQRVYFITYGVNANFNNSSSYEDFTTGRTIFTALSAVADTSSIVLP